MEWQIREAFRHIRAGGVIAYPTESVYGLGCDPHNGSSVQRILFLKRRPPGAGMILIASRLCALEPFLEPLQEKILQRVTETWPGPVTWLLPCRPWVPVWLRGDHHVLAVRVTAHPLAAALCEACGGAIVSTSANIHGHPPARDAFAVRRIFKAQLDYVLNGPTGGRPRPTEIRDALTGRVVRAA
jgi:L-threonylcarbamoyladenylate synthase